MSRERWIAAGLSAGLLLLLAALSFWGLAYHWQLCRFPHQLVPLEAGIYQSARALGRGWDPWSAPLAPDYYNDYGLIYPWLAGQLARLWPGIELLLLMRLLSALSALGIVALSIGLLRRQGLSRLEAWAAGLSVYASLLFWDSVAIRTDCLAVLFYLASLSLLSKAGPQRAAWAGLLTVLGYFTKPYALLALPLGWILTLSQGRRREALIFSLSCALLGLLMSLWVWHAYPLYFLGTFCVHWNARSYDALWVWQQCVLLAQLHGILLGTLGLTGLWAWKRGSLGWPEGAARAWFGAALAAFAVLAAGPAGNRGVVMLYFNQLMVPLAVIAAALLLRQWGLAPALLAGALALNAARGLEFDQRTFPLNAPADEQAWQGAEALVRARPQGLYPAILVSSLAREGAYIASTDHTEQLRLAHWGEHPSPLVAAYQRHQAEIGQRLAQGSFEAVICGGHWPCPQPWPNAHYVYRGQIVLRTPFYQPPGPEFGVYLRK